MILLRTLREGRAFDTLSTASSVLQTRHMSNDSLKWLTELSLQERLGFSKVNKGKTQPAGGAV